MPIIHVKEASARARLNRISHPGSVQALAAALVRWQFSRSHEDPGALLVPIEIPIESADQEKLAESNGPKAPASMGARYRNRARSVRLLIAKKLGIVDEDLVDQITFTKTSSHAWFLGRRPEVTLQAAVAAASCNEETAR